MSVTMKDIAKEANVSIATVSKIINGKDKHISEETRQRVQRIIHERGYRPNSIAKGLKLKQTNTIGFILPDIMNPFFPDIARGIEDYANEKNFAVVYCNTDNDVKREIRSFEFLLSKMVDGIVMTRSLSDTGVAKDLLSRVPVVVVDRVIDVNMPTIGEVYIDTKGAVAAATRHLIKKGCKRPGFISAIESPIKYRLQGYLEALESANIESDSKIIYESEYSVKTGFEGGLKILSEGVDGIVCGNDLIATGVLQAAEEAGLKVPFDLKVIGLDDIYFSRYLYPPLTTIAQPSYEMGKVAAKMLIDHILDGKPLTKQKLSFELIERQST